jgi:hypothetical protein
MGKPSLVRPLSSSLDSSVDLLFIETRYDDIIAILIRSLHAMDPTISLVTSKLYAEYMIRIACWEVDYANLITTRTIQTKFPSLQARVYENVNFHMPFLYIGRSLLHPLSVCLCLSFTRCEGLSPQSIPYFWVRLCPAIESTSTDTGPYIHLPISLCSSDHLRTLQGS